MKRVDERILEAVSEYKRKFKKQADIAFLSTSAFEEIFRLPHLNPYHFVREKHLEMFGLKILPVGSQQSDIEIFEDSDLKRIFVEYKNPLEWSEIEFGKLLLNPSWIRREPVPEDKPVQAIEILTNMTVTKEQLEVYEKMMIEA